MRLDPLLLPAGELIAARWNVGRILHRTASSCLYLALPVDPADQIAALRISAGRAPWDRADTPFFEGRGLLSNALQRIQLQRHEAAVLERLDHPHVIRVLGQGEHRHRPFVALEHFDGVPMGRFAWDPARRLEEIVEVFAALLEALHHIHTRGVVHRDIKPSNVLMRRTAAGSIELRLVDFGLALLDGAGPPGRVGTSLYKAPERIVAEQANRACVDSRSDLYSAGVGLYELLAGVPPFAAGQRLKRDHVLQPPPPLAGAPPALAAVVDTLLAKDLELRYEDGERAAQALRAALGDGDAPVPVPAPNPWAQRFEWARRQSALAPQHPGSQERLARVAREVGELEIATNAAEVAVRLAPGSPRAGIELARCYVAAGRAEAAAAEIGRMLARHGPSSACAELAWAAGDLDAAQRVAWHLLERDPANGRQLWRTLAQSALGALDRAANDPLLWRALARGCAVLGLAEQATAAARRAGGLAPLDPVSEASLALSGADPDAALRRILETLASEQAAPESPLARIHRAEALCDTGEPARAMEMLDGLQHTPPADGPAWSALARVCLRLGLHRPALEAATRACEATPPEHAAWGYRALSHLRLDQHGEAATALARDPGSDAGHGARLLLAAEAPSEVPLALAHAAMANGLRDAAVATATALVLLREGELTQALDAAERATILAPSRPEPWLCVALTAERAGALGLAVDAAERALALAPDPSDQEAIRTCLARCRQRLFP